MKYFRDAAGRIYAFEADGSQDAFIPAGLTAISAEEVQDLTRPPAADPVPASVSRFQAFAAMDAAGVLDQAEQAVAQAGRLAQLAWANAQEFRRESPTVLQLGQALGLTDKQLDDLFIAAASIEA